ncbi:MAG TPA: crosslink repair DNA glycosylase YcaQ family protein, partial [Chthoniobacterales bacterium]|nr:crosslink repair DNA glycosylase YcaQ family protein [Chthoniobacterales bacterium]
EPFGRGVEATLRAIEHLGYVQVDTISVVERAHHHVLWSRVPDYTREHLDTLLAKRNVFEYWGHAASILPMRDFRQSLPLMRSYRSKLHWSDDSPELRRAMRRVVARIHDEGTLRARDFESKDAGSQGAWTFSKIEKRALHELWMRGDIMVSARQGFEKSYDLAARVGPAEIDRSRPSDAEAADFLIRRMLEAHGIAREPEMRYLRGNAAVLRKRLALAVKRGWVVQVRIEGSKVPAYALAETLDRAAEPIEAGLPHILSPFDNLVIQRERLRWLFNFDYLIECYVPSPKRRYGHFVLPVLWGDRFAARLEAKAFRSESRLELSGLWFEPGREGDRSFRRALRASLEQFATFNQCRDLSDPGKLLR